MHKNLFNYHVCDSRRARDVIKNKIIDVVITSPPYWNLKDYGVRNQIGFGQNYEKYLNELIVVLDSCKHILKDNGSMWIVADSFKKGGNVRMLPFEIANGLQQKGWHLQDIIIWQKDKTLPWSSKGKLRNIFEYVLFFTKTNKFNFFVDNLREINLKKWWPKYPERYSPKGKIPSRVWMIPIPIQGWGNSWVKHFCPFPPKLIENILLLTTKKGAVVLDPFAGSGSVLAQATVMGRKSVGFDINPKYKQMYQDTVLPFFKHYWMRRKMELDELFQKRKHLAETILALRKIKYPIVLYKEFAKQRPSAARKLKFIVANDKIPTYYLVFDSIEDDVRNSILELIKTEKMKQFSLNPVIKVITTNLIQPTVFHENKYVYAHGIGNFCANKIDVTEWLSRKSYANDPKSDPPILFNKNISQKGHII